VALGFVHEPAAAEDDPDYVELVGNDGSDNLALFPEHQIQ
jgi:hypothetical protein